MSACKPCTSYPLGNGTRSTPAAAGKPLAPTCPPPQKLQPSQHTQRAIVCSFVPVSRPHPQAQLPQQHRPTAHPLRQGHIGHPPGSIYAFRLLLLLQVQQSTLPPCRSEPPAHHAYCAEAAAVFACVASSTRYTMPLKLTPLWLLSDISHVLLVL
jgi:hypothetical protein